VEGREKVHQSLGFEVELGHVYLVKEGGCSCTEPEESYCGETGE
jgi:hypothetical protein